MTAKKLKKKKELRKRGLQNFIIITRQQSVRFDRIMKYTQRARCFLTSSYKLVVAYFFRKRRENI